MAHRSPKCFSVYWVLTQGLTYARQAFTIVASGGPRTHDSPASASLWLEFHAWLMCPFNDLLWHEPYHTMIGPELDSSAYHSQGFLLDQLGPPRKEGVESSPGMTVAEKQQK